MDNDKLKIIAKQLQEPSSRHKAFADLMHHTQQRLYWHIRKMVLNHDDTNDVLQNTFIKAWKGLEGFRGESQLYTWLYRIATNETLTFLAQQRMRNAASSMEFEDVMLERMEADSYFDGNEAEIKLQKAVLTLPEKQRLVFNMRYYDDIPYEEMSSVLGTSVGALKASYHHAVKKIEHYLTESD